MVYELFDVLLNSVAKILLKIFASMLINDIGLHFSFYVLPLSGFGIRVMVASWNEFGSVPSSAIFHVNVWQNQHSIVK